MAIKLRVISDHYQELGEQRSRVFGVNGGTIGRAPDNDWILPDAKRLVSGHHCEIEYRSGAYWLSDKSTNGVFVNEADDPVSETGPVALQDGDKGMIDRLAEDHANARYLAEALAAAAWVNYRFIQANYEDTPKRRSDLRSHAEKAKLLDPGSTNAELAVCALLWEKS